MNSKILRHYLQLGIPYMYVASAILLIASSVRLSMEYDASIYLEEPGLEDYKAAYLAEPNLSPLVARKWLKSAILECFDLRFDTLTEDLSSCADRYFDSNGRAAFISGLRNTQIISDIEDNPRDRVVTDVAVIQGPSLGSSAGNGYYRYQAVILVSHYFGSRRKDTPFLVDVAMEPSAILTEDGYGLSMTRFTFLNHRLGS